jgi:hypothetical protein
MQFGICTARYVEAESRFELFPFSFTIFPSSLLGEELVFGAQASGLSFLAKNQFDFNKWVHRGIPYLNHHHERTLRARGHGAKPDGADADEPAEQREEVSLNEADETWLVSKVLPHVDEWLAAGSTEPLALAPANGWRRLICHQEIPRRRPQCQTDSEGVDRDKHIVVRPLLDEAAAAELAKKKNETKEAALVTEIGARRVFDLMCARGVPIIGHNCFLDLLFTCHTFHEGPPATVDEFALQLRTLFPAGVFDTKRITSQLEATKEFDTMLEALHKTLATRDGAPSVSLHPAAVEAQSAHDAGYDAFMTAAVFACLRRVAPDDIGAHKGHVGIYGLPIAFNTQAEKPSQSGNELDNVLFVFDFPTTWSTNDLKAMFGKDSLVVWSTDNSAYIKLARDGPTFDEWIARASTVDSCRIGSAAQKRAETTPRLFDAVHGYTPNQQETAAMAVVP